MLWLQRNQQINLKVVQILDQSEVEQASQNQALLKESCNQWVEL